MSTIATRCDRSFPLVHPELVEATILPLDETGGCTAQLREISPSSAKLLVAGPPELPCRCRLRLTSSKLDRPFEVAAEIGWARPNPAGDWLVECEFLSRLDEREFARLLDSGLLERRSAVRFQTRIAVGVRWQPDDPRTFGIIRDLSEGGLCLLTRETPRRTRNVCVMAATPQGEVSIGLKIRWSLAVGPNHLIGCQFVNRDDFHTLRKLPAALVAGYSEHSPGKPAATRT
jgi:hypothetical protein